MREIRGDVSNRHGRRDTLKKVYDGQSDEYNGGTLATQVVMFFEDAIRAIPNETQSRVDLTEMFDLAYRRANGLPDNVRKSAFDYEPVVRMIFDCDEGEQESSTDDQKST